MPEYRERERQRDICAASFGGSGEQEERDRLTAYLERLRVPIEDFLHRRHVIEAVGQVLELLDAVGETYGELLGEELRGAEKGSCVQVTGRC